ncbi:hypothetical protein CK203_028799 [Vitis vinifera]|uniref:O-acyltransferase WSD1 C-terminal domain-containing protein n=1 Tax=Vitis vinifera TaxID=29760 RepID=A0A438IF46_VITVI|nr:hypothetical protein CK203_109470 [Vitis vinifera]RVW95358.1 hypothetical protein CK203_028799 [Vitis vinifera]
MERKKASLEALYIHSMAKSIPNLFGTKALMIHVVSYVDKMNIILSVDESTVPDPHQLFDDLEESFNLIKNAALAEMMEKESKVKGGNWIGSMFLPFAIVLYDDPLNYALMIHVVSYVDKMNIILSVDESTVPDPHQLFDDLEESFNLIKNVVMARD